MKSEYDFSKGERGKFYHPDAESREIDIRAIRWPYIKRTFYS